MFFERKITGFLQRIVHMTWEWSISIGNELMHIRLINSFQKYHGVEAQYQNLQFFLKSFFFQTL
jgi:hypothetical protein